MPEIIYCENCRYCRHVRKKDGREWIECRQLFMLVNGEFKPVEVVEDDYCSFGGDIPPEYEDEDKAYERKKYNE